MAEVAARKVIVEKAAARIRAQKSFAATQAEEALNWNRLAD
jgi:hypothetical protein